MSDVRRREFVAFLLATFAAASAPALAVNARRREMFTLKSFPLPVGSEITAVAETTGGSGVGRLRTDQFDRFDGIGKGHDVGDFS
jgi:hypothetical protein